MENSELIIIPQLYEQGTKAVCQCVTEAGALIVLANPKYPEAMKAVPMNAQFPDTLEDSLTNLFTSLAHSLIWAERDVFDAPRKALRELYTTPPEPLGDVSGPSYNDMGLRFAEHTFDIIQEAADLIRWKIPIRHATTENIEERAKLIGGRASRVLPKLWQRALRCPAQRLNDYIENEAARGIKAWRDAWEERQRRQGKTGL